MLGAWPKVANLKPYWLVGMVLAEALSCLCLWELQALSIGTRDHMAVATSQLAGGALGRVIPGGAATAAAAQYNMLNAADVPRAAIATGLAAGDGPAGRGALRDAGARAARRSSSASASRRRCWRPRSSASSCSR